MSKDPTFRLLDGAFLGDGRNALMRAGVALDSRGVTLAESTAAESPLRLDAVDGSLGRLTLPRGCAVDTRGVLYLQDAARCRVLRFDEEKQGLQELPWVGGLGYGARQWVRPVNLAIAGENLYVADAERRQVQVFALGNLALRFAWQLDTVCDVCSGAGAAYVLDGERGRVYRHRPGASDALALVLDAPENAGRWSRLAVDREGRLYLLSAPAAGSHGARAVLSVYSAAGNFEQECSEAGDVRDHFLAPSVTTRAGGLLAWGGRFFTHGGEPVAVQPDASPGPAPFATGGVWVAGPRGAEGDAELTPLLDSGTYRCAWHRIEVEADLPPGTRIVLRTHTEESVRADAEIAAMAPDEWDTAGTLVGGLQPGDDSRHSTDFLVQSLAGRYLWLRVELEGTGFLAPTLEGLRVHFPRESYLDYLPELYSADEEGRRFLERFLAVFKTEWDSLEQRLASVAGHFDAKAVPAEFADWLATWVALPMEQFWGLDEKRHALSTIPATYGRTGTADALRQYVRVYLENLGRRLPEGQPAVIESFLLRRQTARAASRGEQLPQTHEPSVPWMPAELDRLQVGGHARVGAARLVSEGTPQTDFFAAFAHRFELFVPAASLRSDAEERSLRQAIEAAKPAHTRYALHAVDARQRVGVQSSVGVDTVLGAYPQLRLSSLEASAGRAPSAPPQSRLGYDTVLAAVTHSDGGFAVSTSGARIGMTTALK